ncbi:GNAT family N-acetyltransferase [Bifidobacterium thermophilum]|uniref:GNAT family N-acetyltransferase n=1 Tax=Bifidobacterium thermophilum TaxID=33905 RepID=UPI003996525D
MVSPAEYQADCLYRVLLSEGMTHPVLYETVKALRDKVAWFEGIVVVPEYRRRGIGLQVKRFVDRWAAQHHADFIISSPSNAAARRLNEETGHKVLEPGVDLVFKLADFDTGEESRVVFPVERGMDPTGVVDAVRQLRVPHGRSLRFGQYPVPAGAGVDLDGREHHVPTWDYGRIGWFEWDARGYRGMVFAPAPGMRVG